VRLTLKHQPEAEEQTMQPKIVTKPAFTVVGLRIHTKPMTQEIPQLWDQFVPRMGRWGR
jgi:hypothetical protein